MSAVSQPLSLALADQTDASPRRSTYIPFLEGLRGIAALYVVCAHLRVHNLPAWAATLNGWANYGHAAVGVFIVLSGYCLMLPVAQSADGELRGGWQNYLLRRAKRILPPYYVALLLSLPVEYFHQRSHSHAINIGALVSHLFLVHNLNSRWNEAINVPMWSVATEWQIYFFLPFVLLPLWRRFGMGVTTLCAFAVGLSPHFLLPRQYNFDWACPWYLGLFSLGMWGAVVTERTASASRKLPGGATSWLLASLAFLGVVIGLYAWFGGHPDQHIFIVDPFTGLCAFIIDPFIGLCAICLIVACTLATREAANAGWKRIILSLLQSRSVQRLGTFSYSLYLTHSPVYYSAGWLIARHVHSPVALQVAHYVLLLPLMLVFAYGFCFLFERPLMIAKKKSVPILHSAPAPVTETAER